MPNSSHPPHNQIQLGRTRLWYYYSFGTYLRARSAYFILRTRLQNHMWVLSTSSHGHEEIACGSPVLSERKITNLEKRKTRLLAGIRELLLCPWPRGRRLWRAGKLPEGHPRRALCCFFPSGNLLNPKAPWERAHHSTGNPSPQETEKTFASS